MVPSIELSPQTFKRLQKLAKPFVDDPEMVVARLITFFEQNSGSNPPVSAEIPTITAQRFNPISPPDLTHTKVLAVEMAGRPLNHAQTNWNQLLDEAVRMAKRSAKNSKELRQLITIPFKEEEDTDKGYRFLSDVGISIQGQDSNGAWKAACHIVQKLGVAFSVTFVWRDKASANRAGVTGQFRINGK